MAPTKEEFDRALNEIKGTLANRESMIAKAYADHPDPNAWYHHFLNCLSMIAQGPLSKVEDNIGSVAPARGVKRRRVQDDEEELSQGASDGGRVLETEGEATYRFRGLARFRVETTGGSTGDNRTSVYVKGYTKVLVEDATSVEVEQKPVPETFTFTKPSQGREAKGNRAMKSEAGDSEYRALEWR
ncbi:hypothetical protein B0T20DRAFT_387187 [Sordaria brevicollis]|uniref:Uncharacterized protein n=1 Tax=Sordaria brevicollis TaxID=83679 RepID=A0AAE0NVE5_SORBR|nr:hypothetical protein B0T20DRAFT_387187 [Sordaria brevicollis]